MDLKTALQNWESAGDSLTTLDSNLTAATVKVGDIQAKLDTAKSDMATAQTTDDQGATAYNSATDELIAALAGSKRIPSPFPSPFPSPTPAPAP